MDRAIVVSELGQNWNGNFDLLIEMTDRAFECGTDLVKIQLRSPRECVPKPQWKKPKEWLDGTILSYIEYRERLEITENQLKRYDKYVKNKYGNKWFASIWDKSSLKKLTQFTVPYIKIPSALATNHDLICDVIETNIPIVLSTGMSTEDEIASTLNLFSWNYDLTILHCNSTYPAPDNGIDLLAINYLFNLDFLNDGPFRYGRKWRIGFSSHHVSPHVPIYSAVLGAQMIEVHFTLSRAMWGSDQSASLESPGLSLLCREVERIPVLLGKPQIKLYDSENQKRESLRGV